MSADSPCGAAWAARHARVTAMFGGMRVAAAVALVVAVGSLAGLASELPATAAPAAGTSTAHARKRTGEQVRLRLERPTRRRRLHRRRRHRVGDRLGGQPAGRRHLPRRGVLHPGRPPTRTTASASARTTASASTTVARPPGLMPTATSRRRSRRSVGTVPGSRSPSSATRWYSVATPLSPSTAGSP